MEMQINVYNLVIEVTRRCNMCCTHCLRGDAQDLDISDEVLETVARNIQPSSVTFTGGEPSLNIAAQELKTLLEKTFDNPEYAA